MTDRSASDLPDTSDYGWGYPTFSLDERDLRWGRVRELMAKQGIDCLVASACTGVQGRAHTDVKYLTQLGNNDEQYGVVFPVEGTPAVTGWPGRRPGDSWIEDRRDLVDGFLSPVVWGRTLAALVEEMGCAEGTVAVCGLEPTGPRDLSGVRQSEGYIPYATMRELERALPAARFVGAQPVIGPARYVKSDEEVEFIRTGVSIAERALYAMVAGSHSGAFEPAIYGQMLAAELSVGGTLPTMISWASGPPGLRRQRLEQPVARRLRSGDLVSVEIEGRWAGYNGQVDATMTVGDVPAFVHPAHAINADAIEAALEAIKPGVTFGEVRRAAEGVTRSDDYSVALIMHGRGLGDDGPLVGVRGHGPNAGVADDLVLEEQTCFDAKPAVAYRGTWCSRIGETFAVRASGAERLGRRELRQLWHVD